MKKSSKLSYKVLFGLLSSMLVGILLVGHVAAVRKNDILEKLYYDQSLLVAASLDASIGEVDVGDTDLLQRQVYKYSWLNPDILHLSISRLENNELIIAASTQVEKIGQKVGQDSLNSYNEDELSSYSEKIEGDRVLRIISPIHVGGKVVGTYDMALSLESRDSFISKSIRNLVILILGVMTLIVFSVWMLLRLIVVVPIHRLAKDFEEFGGGNIGKRARVIGNDEISFLAEGFNQMADKIDESQEKLSTEIKSQSKELDAARIDLENQGLAILNVLEDVSEEKEYESSRSQSLLETVNEGIVIVSEKGLIEYVNPAFEKLLGFSEEFLKGKVLADSLETYDLKDEKLPPNFLASSSVVAQNDGEAKLQVIDKNNKKIAVSISAAPVYQAGDFKGVVMVFHDFSKDFQIVRQKDDFFSIASHELRTPLTVISGNLDMISTGIGGSKLTKEDRDMLDDTMKSSDRLIRMVSDFLNVSRLDQGRLKLHNDEINIHALISEIGKNYKSLAEKKGLKLIINCPIEGMVVSGDEDKLREVIINLLGNSLKFTKKGFISMEAGMKDDMLEVRMTDTGMGIPKDNRDLLFQRFQQAMSRALAREAGGTGLGLYISREFMKLMGGDLYLIESEEGRGSTFAFTIPVIKKAKTKKIK